jgi:hypothetical protein
MCSAQLDSGCGVFGALSGYFAQLFVASLVAETIVYSLPPAFSAARRVAFGLGPMWRKAD